MKKKARILAIILMVLGIFLLACFGVYQYQTSPVDKNSKADIEVVIPSGMSTAQIASLLKEKGLIKNPTFFKLYLKLNGVSSLKASTYLLQKNMTMASIASLLEKGTTYNKDAVRLTFPEGKTIESYAKLLEEKTNITANQFLTKMKDQAYIQELITKYWFLTEDILHADVYYPLEGYLAPDTYEFKNKEVAIEDVVTTLLQQMEENLASSREQLEKVGVHRTLTLASMAELEGVQEKDRKLIVGVFENRLVKKMSLGSDVTTYYAFHQEMTGDLSSTMFNTYNPYNTRSSKMAGKLPIGPICNPSLESIKASLVPTKSDYLYFVADKNGKIYYTKTQQEHDKTVATIKENGDWIW